MTATAPATDADILSRLAVPSVFKLRYRLEAYDAAAGDWRTVIGSRAFPTLFLARAAGPGWRCLDAITGRVYLPGKKEMAA